jgi:ComF family protein
MHHIYRLTLDLISLLFPQLCNGCGTNLAIGEKEICLHCLFDLPYTDYHLHAENKVAKQFWGRLACRGAMAMCYFKKGTKIQNLIHNLKYNGKMAVGVKLGNLLGEKLRSSTIYSPIDLIIPVPLHPKKQKSRGYNQSECIATGIAQTLNAPISIINLVRCKATETQTRKARYTRFENMVTVFETRNAENLKNLHILLIDDVITTGATLEACGIALLNAGIGSLSIATVAFAE